MPAALLRLWTALWNIMSSLRTTIVLFALLMVLVVACTLAQVSIGTLNAVDVYFRSFFVWAKLPATDLRVPIYPAGATVGVLLLFNLAASQFYHLEWTAKKAGLWFTHVGIVLLILGEFFTGMFAVETRMALEEGETKNYVESPRETELAFIETSAADSDTVVAVPDRLLASGARIVRGALPFWIEVRRFFPNSHLEMATGASELGINRGVGTTVKVSPMAVTSRDDEVNTPSVVVELKRGGESLGTWLYSMALGAPQQLLLDGKSYTVVMRNRREYLPYSITLKDFRHDRYPGTDIPRNFSSLVKLRDQEHGEERDALIWMNHPLRYRGKAFYQSSFGKDDTLSIFQVVENPAWLLPYVSFGLVTLGLVVHFWLHLSRFLRQRAAKERGRSDAKAGEASGLAEARESRTEARESRTEARESRTEARESNYHIIPWIVVVLGVVWLGVKALPERPRGGFDLEAAGALPVLSNGRVKPLDTLARTSLLMIRGRQELSGRSATEWLWDLMTKREKADAEEIFLIHDPDLVGLLGHEPTKKKLFSFKELEPRLKELGQQAEAASQLESPQRSRFQTALVNLWDRVVLYQRLRMSFIAEGVTDPAAEFTQYQEALAAGLAAFRAREEKRPFDQAALNRLSEVASRYQTLDRWSYFHALPPRVGEPSDQWRSIGAGVLEPLQGRELHPLVQPYLGLVWAHRADDAAGFSAKLDAIQQWLGSEAPRAQALSRYEVMFNHVEPFYEGIVLYVAVFLLVCFSWLWLSGPLQRSAYYLLLLAFVVHTAGLTARIWLQGRPPVTNLYSSAIFVGWVAVLLGIVLEKIFRNSIGSLVAALVGFVTLVVAHNLTGQGDTMEMMRAVLDSNFWLATHVVTITIGYSGTYLAGAIAYVYIFRRLFSPSFLPEHSAALVRMTYGIVCFSLLFSFVGTVLGGIWADQSWGRFWGWDPKENGALLIVLWNAIILHARWGGLIRERGLMLLAVFGMIVTSLSWFGVNMLGIGLHSYGFMDKAFIWLVVFTVAQLAVIGVGLIPRRRTAV